MGYKLKECKLEVTYRCVLKCMHCSSNACTDSPTEMSLEDCLRILDELIEMRVQEVAFSGGEPLLWPFIDQALDVACKGGIQTLIYTSGNIPHFSEKAAIMHALKVKACIFSVFGATSTEHEKITKIKGSFQNTLAAVEIANNVGLHTEFHFVPLSVNYKEIEDISKLAKNIGVAKVSLLRFVPQGRGKNLQNQILNCSQNLELQQTIVKIRQEGLIDIRLGSPYNFLLLPDTSQCHAGVDRINISPDLRIYPCDAFKQLRAENLVGTIQGSSLHNTSLKECWEASPYLKMVRDCLNKPFEEPCASCQNQNRCGSGCLAQKIIASGKVGGADPLCLKQA